MRALATSLCALACLFSPGPTRAEDYQFAGSVEVTDLGFSILRMTYTNRSRAAQCIHAEDLRNHPMRESLRITNQDNVEARYVGPRAAQGDNESFYILPPGRAVTAKFLLAVPKGGQHHNNYALDAGVAYNARYSLPVTKCKAILRGLEAIPSSYAPFMVNSEAARNWPDRLKVVRDTYPEWSRNGFFAELDPVAFSVGDEK